MHQMKEQGKNPQHQTHEDKKRNSRKRIQRNDSKDEPKSWQ